MWVIERVTGRVLTRDVPANISANAEVRSVYLGRSAV